MVLMVVAQLGKRIRLAAAPSDQIPHVALSGLAVQEGHGSLFKSDPSPMPPLQWLWLAGDGCAA